VMWQTTYEGETLKEIEPVHRCILSRS